MLRKKLVFGCVILSLIVTACGGIGAPRTIKIVSTMPLDAVEGEGVSWTVVHAMQLALEEAKYQAGNFTIKFEVNGSADAQGMPITAKEEEFAKKAAADPEVMVYMGSMTSGGCKVSLPILNRVGMAQLSTTATYPGLTKSGFAAGEPGIYYPAGARTFFRFTTPDDMQGPAAALWAKDVGATRLYVFKQDDTFGQGLARTFVQTAEGAGMTVVGTGVITESQTSGFEGIVADIAAQKADLVFHAGYNSKSGIVLTQMMRDKGMTTRMMGASLYGLDTLSELGPKAEGVLAFAGEIEPDNWNADTKDFVSRFQKRYNRELGPRAWSAILGYDAMRVVLAAVKQAGKADRAAILGALRKTDLKGLVGQWSFDENGDARLLLVTGFVVKDGKWQSQGLLRVR